MLELITDMIFYMRQFNNPLIESAGRLESARLFEYMYQPFYSTETRFDSTPTQFQGNPAYKNRVRALIEARQRRI